MRILVCGSRNWRLGGVIAAALRMAPKDSTVIHGCCRGADASAGAIAWALGLRVEEYPADWDKHGRSAGPRRNAQMIATKPDVVLAFSHEPDKGGTADCIRKAQTAGIPVIVWPVADDWVEQVLCQKEKQ